MTNPGLNKEQQQQEVALNILGQEGARTEQEQLPYPDLPPVAFCCLEQTTKLRCWCLKIIHIPWLDNVSTLMVLFNCVTLFMYKPYEEPEMYLEVWEALILAYFFMEMLVKMVAVGFLGYFRNSWNKCDFIINCGEVVDYILGCYSPRWQFFQAFRPVRLCGRIPRLRALVTALANTLPMLANMLLIIMLVIHIFSVVGVQLWAGELLNRCFLGEDIPGKYNVSLNPYYISKYGERSSFVCSPGNRGGMRNCSQIPASSGDEESCTLDASHYNSTANQLMTLEDGTGGCVNWNQYYNVCRPGERNPRMGVISFDNIVASWVVIFQVVTMEGWTEIMFYVMDAYSFWSFLVFVLMTILGAIVMMNVCAVVIAARFSEIMDHSTNDQDGASAVAHLFLRFISWVRRKFCGKNRNQSTVFPEIRDGKRRILGQIWLPPKKTLKKIVDNALFKQLMKLVVVLSVLSLVLEHHEQPKMLTYVLRINDIIFAVIFLMEMILKLLALEWQYFTDRNNIVDFVIAITSLVVVAGKAKGFLPVLRSLRLLRFGRFLCRLSYVERQLLVLKKAAGKALGLCILLMGFTYTFSILGMLVFGGKFEFESRLGDLVNARKNFDTLRWSMVTVFEVFTQDAWNLVLYNAIAATSAWATLYFVLLLLLGKHVLLNVLVGIVIKSFQDIAKQTGTSTAHDPPQTDQRTEDGQLIARSEPSRSVVAPNKTETSRIFPTEIQSFIQRIVHWCKEREDWALYVLSPQNRFRVLCQRVTSHRMFENLILLLILISCATIAVERPGINPKGMERFILKMFLYVLSAVFLVEMLLKILAQGLFIGKDSYCRCRWNIIDGLLVILSLVHVFVSLTKTDKTNMLSILKILRLLRTLRPLRVIKHAPKLRLAVEALITSTKPMGSIVLCCCISFFFYAIIGVQLFKGKFFYCRGRDITNITTKNDCLAADYHWKRRTFNFDNVPQAVMSLFVMYTKNGWVDVMYDGLDAVGKDRQPIRNYNEWMLVYFISFMLMSYLLLDMFIGVMVHTFHRCQRNQREADALLLQEGGGAVQRRQQEPVKVPYFAEYSKMRRCIHSVCVSSFLDLLVTAAIVLSVLVMAIEHHNQPQYVEKITEYSYYVFTAIFVMEVLLKLVAFGVLRFMRDRWNLLDIAVVLISIVSIIFNEMKVADEFPINPSILRVCRVLRLAQVLKTKKIRILLNTIIKTLSQVGNICLLFMFFFFIYAALGVELFGKLECSENYRCMGLHQYTNFNNFGMALLTLYRVCTGDNWSSILRDTLRECRPGKGFCPSYLRWVSPIYFSTFVIMAQFVLLNLVVASIMQALEDSKQEESSTDLQTWTSVGENIGPAPAQSTNER